MRDRSDQHFLPLLDFWSDILFAQTSSSPPADVVGHLDTMFGGLTRHALAPRDSLPVGVECTQCRNNQGDRRDAVCQTHVGVVRGTLEARIGVPLRATWEPGSQGHCRIQLERELAEDGRPLEPRARRAPWVRMVEHAGAHFIADDRTGWMIAVAPAVAATLASTTTFRGVAELASELGRDHAEVGAILNACLANGWMERSYRIATNGG